MVQLRPNRNQTSFYRPTETPENRDVLEPSRRNKLFNPKTRRWIQDTPRNRARLQNLIVRSKIRNPRTGRMVTANARNIRDAERFREQRVREMIERRAANRIATRTRRFIQQRSRVNDFNFEETSANFQTATLTLPADIFKRGGDNEALRQFLSTHPNYRSYRLFLGYTKRRTGETNTISTKVSDVDGFIVDIIHTALKRLIALQNATHRQKEIIFRALPCLAVTNTRR